MIRRLGTIGHTRGPGDLTSSEEEALLREAAKATGFHHGVGVYKNGDFVQNCIPDFELSQHIQYNVTMRPGRGLFIDGNCVHDGYLDDEEVKAWEEKIADWPMPKLSYPRQ